MTTVKAKCPTCYRISPCERDAQGNRVCPRCSSRFLYRPGRYTGENNTFFRDGCPALMSDGRFITSYTPSNELTENIRHINGIENTNQFREFLQTNGNRLMNKEREYLWESNTCAPKTACSEGWYDLWMNKGGYWGNEYVR